MFEISLILVIVSLSSWAWLSWYRRKELEHPRLRPWRWIYRYFAGGILSALVLSFLVPLYDSLLPGPPEGFLPMLLLAGLPEEGIKFLAFRSLARREKLREPFDAVARGALVGLGFAAFENVIYGLYYGVGVALGRSFLTLQGHMLFTAISAGGWSLARLDPRLREEEGWQGLSILGYCAAAIIHAWHNAIPGTGHSFYLDFFSWAGLILAVTQLGSHSPFRNWSPSDAAQAVRAIDLALLSDPDNPNLLYRRGLYSMATYEWLDAVIHFDAAAENGKREALLRSWQAIALLGGGDEEEALAALDRWWPMTSRRERASFLKVLDRMLPGRYLFRRRVKEITRGLEWMPRPETGGSKPDESRQALAQTRQQSSEAVT